jgi:hypothetical protein
MASKKYNKKKVEIRDKLYFLYNMIYFHLLMRTGLAWWVMARYPCE